MASFRRRGKGSRSAMALVVPPPNDKKRVKVYELRHNDWFDRGTGFCTGRVVGVRKNPSDSTLGHESTSFRDPSRSLANLRNTTLG